MAKLTRERKNSTVYRILEQAGARGLILNRAESGNGPTCVIRGKTLQNFGSCSYMALERHPALVAGVQKALELYGTQFHFSRAYLDAPLYRDVEGALSEITGQPTLVAASSTLAHLAALPVLVADDDVVLIDQFAHASLHLATEVLKGTLVERIRHNRMDLLEEKLKAYAGTNRRVWYLCDGVYSMLGDFADFAGLNELLARYPALHLYVDDAHAMSWIGKHGRGAALSALSDTARVVVTLSLNKAFSAAGCAVVFPNETLLGRVRRCGAPMVFSGPIQPPMLGAALGAAELHLDPSFSELQAELDLRIDTAQKAIEGFGLRVATAARTPIFMVQFEALTSAQDAVAEMMARGYLCCLSAFPAVPIDTPSLRFTVSRHNRVADIQAFVAELAAVVGRPSELEAARAS